MVKLVKILVALLLVGYCYVSYNYYVNNPSIVNVSIMYILGLATIWTIFFLLLKDTQYKNWFITSSLCLSMTCILNGFIVILNNGFMPIRADILQRMHDNNMMPLFSYYVVGGKLGILGDYFPVGFAAISIGDMFAGISVVILIILLIKATIEEVVGRLSYAS